MLWEQSHRPASPERVGAGGERLCDAIKVLPTSRLTVFHCIAVGGLYVLREPLGLRHRKMSKMNAQKVLVLLGIVSVCGAQKWEQDTSPWNPKEHSSSRKCSNLTQVLDNWKFAIVTQVKELLINDHASVLPEYNRIQPLSEALGDLYRQFNNLKDELGRLTAKFDNVEAFVDELRDGRFPAPQRWVPPSIGLRSPLRAQMKAPDRRIVTRPTLIRARGRGPGRA